MKGFVLPGFSEKFKVNKKLIELYQHEPYRFYDDIKFDCFYGIFGYCIWCGGRVFSSYDRGYYEDLVSLKEFYESYNIPIRLTFTNPLITEEHLYDKYSNMIVATLQNGNNEILTASPILEQYLKENYPDYKYCSSTTKCLTTPEAVKTELNSNYFQVCLDYNMNHNMTLLNSLNDEEKNKCEFLCNAICPPGCPNRKEHYRLNGVAMLNGGKAFEVNCGIKYNTLNVETCNYKNNISPEEIIETYEPLGFSHFKLEGRTWPDSELACNYVRYLIKPEYHLETIHILLS